MFSREGSQEGAIDVLISGDFQTTYIIYLPLEPATFEQGDATAQPELNSACSHHFTVLSMKIAHV